MLTNSMEQSPSWEANRSSAAQEIPHILWNPKVHRRIQNSLSPVPVLSRTVGATTFYPQRPSLNLRPRDGYPRLLGKHKTCSCINVRKPWIYGDRITPEFQHLDIYVCWFKHKQMCFLTSGFSLIFYPKTKQAVEYSKMWNKAGCGVLQNVEHKILSCVFCGWLGLN
jgi:hypothetical protein